MRQVGQERLEQLEQGTLQKVQDQRTQRNQGLHVMDRLVSDDVSNLLLASFTEFHKKVKKEGEYV